MTFTIFRCCGGEKAGCVDFLDEIEVSSMSEAERYAADHFDLGPDERFSIEEGGELPQ
jgi:hypothetical protein